MLHSMTGFARASAESTLGTLTWELRAVNHRYLDIQFKMPDELRASEPRLRQQLGDRLRRGKVECSLHFLRAFDAGRDLELDNELVGLLARRLAEISSLLEDAAAVNPMDLLRWPGVIQSSDTDGEALAAAASALLATALDALETMRRAEGGRIGELIDARCAEVLRIAAAVRARMPEVLESTRARQRDRLSKLELDADPDRLEVELALVAQKLDVDEELDRLESHVREIRDSLATDEPVGRRLDFLMQELNREANTLGSKSADTETTRAAVDLKVLIEQMREQIQNVE
jgi:uncharacterized protein (TIGR00255 family)